MFLAASLTDRSEASPTTRSLRWNVRGDPGCQVPCELLFRVILHVGHVMSDPAAAERITWANSVSTAWQTAVAQQLGPRPVARQLPRRSAA
jgi:hypothetical protein